MPGRPGEPSGRHVVPGRAAGRLTGLRPYRGPYSLGPSARTVDGQPTGERKAASDATYMAESWAPQSSRAECIASCGAPTSTVVTPKPPAVIGPTVEPQGRSARCS